MQVSEKYTWKVDQKALLGTISIRVEIVLPGNPQSSHPSQETHFQTEAVSKMDCTSSQVVPLRNILNSTGCEMMTDDTDDQVQTLLRGLPDRMQSFRQDLRNVGRSYLTRAAENHPTMFNEDVLEAIMSSDSESEEEDQ
jgi:hypothetical protein